MSLVKPVLVVQILNHDKKDALHKTGILVKTPTGVVISVEGHSLLDGDCLWADLECQQFIHEGKLLTNPEVAALMKLDIIPKLCRGNLGKVQFKDSHIIAVCTLCDTIQHININEQLSLSRMENISV